MNKLIRPTLIFLNNLYYQINQEAFGNRLPPVRIEIGRATRQMGCFIYPINIVGRPIDNLNRCKIRISSAYERYPDDFRDTLAHEMIHLYIWLAGVKESHHGPTFRRMMEDINNRCGYGLGVTVRDGAVDHTTAPVKSYLVVVTWRDGIRTISRVATTFIFRFHRFLKENPEVKSQQWYGSSDGWFRRYPTVRTAKFFKITDSDYDKYVAPAVPLIFRNNQLIVAPNT